MHDTPVANAIRKMKPISLDEVRQATRHREWAVEFQPIVDLRSGRWVGAEALLRWRHPSRGWLMPDQFIEVVESSEEIFPVTNQVMGLVSEALGRLALNQHDIYLSLNLVGAHFRRTATLHELLWAVQRVGVDPSKLMIELTERGAVDDSGGVISDLMARMCQNDFRLAIDDFGSREASLEYLQRFPVSQLKIDKCLIDSIDVLPKARKVLQGLVEFARCLDVKIVAEGVERERQMTTLRSLGVPFAQGFALARPMSLEVLEASLAAQSAHWRQA